MMRFWLPLLLSASILSAQEPAFRTDETNDESLEWYQLQPGEFPPEGSAHYFTGELIALDHVNRTATLRTDRTDEQRRSHWDLPVDFRMLPYGSIYYHGAPAALKDIPIGTHLHGLFYIKGSDEEVDTSSRRVSPEVAFTRCFRLEDDFSYYSRQNQAWRVDEVNLGEKKLTATLLTGGKSGKEQTVFDLLPWTRVWTGHQVGTLENIASGQTVQLNLTWATLYGAGRITNIWLDEESRQLALEHQLQKHRHFQREHGLAARIDEVDNQKRIITATIFGGIDPELLKDFEENTTVTVVVAEPTLRTYDQVNDRKRGSILEIRDIPVEPGSSGVQIVFQPDLLLEGYRPDRIIRLFAADWPLLTLPMEQRLWPPN